MRVNRKQLVRKKERQIMSTVAINRTNGYAKREEKVSLAERFSRYFGENAKSIALGMAMMNGNVSIYNMYKYGNMMK